MKLNNLFIACMLMCSFSLLSYESSPDSGTAGNMPQAEMQLNNHNMQPLNSWHFSANVHAIPNYSQLKLADYSVIAHQASPQLKNYFATVVTPLMYDAMINNHYVSIPGYVFPDGIRHCANQLSQFSHSDAALIKSLSKRLETYCARIENILFNGKNHSFCDALSYKDQIKLIKGYANFLKEFYGSAAPHTFYYTAQTNPLMQRVMPSITWDQYDAGNTKSSLKKIEQYNAASINGHLGKVYKALHQGNSEQACAIGQERIKTIVCGKEKITSVFESYPALRQKVEQVYCADKAKIEQERLAKQAVMQQDAVQAQAHYEKQNDEVLFQEQKHSDLLKDRVSAALTQYYDPQIFKKLHTLMAEQAVHIDAHHLTSDQKGILCEGGHLQHYLVDEAISGVDTAISGDLVENMQDAVLDLANTSLTLNKEGDVMMASRTLDACWALIDHAQAIAQYTYNVVKHHAPLIVKGAAEGVRESLQGAVHAVCHPIEAVQEVAQSLAVAGYYVGKLAYSVYAFDAACELLEADPEHFDQKIREHVIDPQVFTAVYEHVTNNVSTEDVARVGTKAVVDTMLLHGVTKVVSAIAEESVAAFISCMRKAEQSADVALTAENISVKCGEEIASVVQKMENTVQNMQAATEIITDSRASIESLTHGFLQEVVQEVEFLKKLFDCKAKGFAEFSNQWIKIPYAHILGMELKWAKEGSLIKFSGFHLDIKQTIEKSGAIQFINKIVNEHGCYKASLIIDGLEIPKKTFFPAHWSRQQVIEKIYEAYDNFIKSGMTCDVCKNGKYKINGFTKEGIEIEMFFNKNGQMATAYPIVK